MYIIKMALAAVQGMNCKRTREEAEIPVRNLGWYSRPEMVVAGIRRS